MIGFLRKHDFNRIINGDNIDQLTGGNDKLLFDMVEDSIEEVASYIRHYYDYELVFKPMADYSGSANFTTGDRVFWFEQDYSDQATYSIGERVNYAEGIYSASQAVTIPEAFDPAKWQFLAENNSYYTCIQNSTGNLPNDDTYFENKDSRNRKIVQLTVDVALYHLHSKISPRNVPDVRRVRYDGAGNVNQGESAISYLIRVQKGNVQLDLPVKTPVEQNGQRVIYGQLPTENYNY